MRNLTPTVLRGLLIGLVLVLISLPGLFTLHGVLGLGTPPATGLLVLGTAVALTLALANVAGAMIGQSRGNGWLAALAGLGIGILSCVIVAPLYGGMVMDSLSHGALGLAWEERSVLVQGTRDAASGGARDAASNAWSAAREGRLRAEFERWEKESQNAKTPEARQTAKQRSQALAKVLTLLKSSAARLSAFALLVWTIIAPPLGATYECRRAKR